MLNKIYPGAYANEQLNLLKREHEIEAGDFNESDLAVMNNASKRRFRVGVVLATM